MGDVVNLNRFRKRRARDEKARQAETNRRLHGRTKAERAAEAARKARLAGVVDGARLDAPTSPGAADGDASATVPEALDPDAGADT